MEGKETFQHAGGSDFHYIPALNENDDWIHAMTQIALENLQGWVSAEWDNEKAKNDNALRQSRAETIKNALI